MSKTLLRLRGRAPITIAPEPCCPRSPEKASKWLFSSPLPLNVPVSKYSPVYPVGCCHQNVPEPGPLQLQSPCSVPILDSQILTLAAAVSLDTVADALARVQFQIPARRMPSNRGCHRYSGYSASRLIGKGFLNLKARIRRLLLALVQSSKQVITKVWNPSLSISDSCLPLKVSQSTTV